MGADSPPTKIFFVLVTIWNKNYNNIRNKVINNYLSRVEQNGEYIIYTIAQRNKGSDSW